jgi:Xaa-Pro aminopeptidase
MLKEFAQRRQRLFAQMGPNAIAIIIAAPEHIRNGDNHYPYRQHSDFYYLTGFTEPQAIAVLSTVNHQQRYYLFNRPHDAAKEIWDGYRAGQEGACQAFGADESYPIVEFETKLAEWLNQHQRVYYSLGQDMRLDRLLGKQLATLRSKNHSPQLPPQEIVDVSTLTHEMRLIKNATEIELMRQAAKITAHAHIRAMQACHPGAYEYELEAEILHEFTRCGSRSPAYACIVGGGANACILHYQANNVQLQDGDLVLIDAGAEYQHYAADVTRTFPVNGRFSPHQRALYEIVLAAQSAGIAAIKPNARWPEIETAISQVITEGLVNLGILKGKPAELIAAKAYKRFYMHNFGHWLGLDVHDVGRYQIDGNWRPLLPGMVLTVEPGIYIPAHSENVDAKWWNIGIRIEDDVLVTEQGNEVLSATAPKTITDIEAIMSHA